MFTKALLLFSGTMILMTPVARAEEAKITWYDPSCGFMIVELADEFGMYQWKGGPEPAIGDIISGEISGGPAIEADLKPSGSRILLTHWGDAKSSELLIKHTPRGCQSKRKKK